MQYRISHVTRFTYEASISESVMEVRMQPRTEGRQRCLHFGLKTSPASRPLMYLDHDGNTVHHFDIPGRHSRLVLTAEALVEVAPVTAPAEEAEAGTWADLDTLTDTGDWWDALAPSTFARPTPRLHELARSLDLQRGANPMATMQSLMGAMFSHFEYRPESTEVDSPIDVALQARQGVCQDFAHIFIALGRQLGVPCRYVSGYLCHQPDHATRSSDGATHAWVEAYLPGRGWTGFDPTNNLLGDDRHIRVAVGRDYADVPPTKGVFTGTSAVRSELAVAVRVASTQRSAAGDNVPFVPWLSREAAAPLVDEIGSQQQ